MAIRSVVRQLCPAGTRRGALIRRVLSSPLITKGPSTLRNRMETFAVGLIARSPRMTKAIVHRSGSPTHYELLWRVGSSHIDPRSFLARALDDADVEPFLDEAKRELASLRAAEVRRNYPALFAVGNDTALITYVIVRALRPGIMVETGVADGLTTALILAAMQHNDTGVLHSIDVKGDVGAFVQDRRRWRLHITTGSNDEFATILEGIGPLDAFLHDGAHDYEHQMFEYRAVWPQLRPGGIMLSDDVDWSYAFLDWTTRCPREASQVFLNPVNALGLIAKK